MRPRRKVQCSRISGGRLEYPCFCFRRYKDDGANEGATRRIVRPTYLGNGVNDGRRDRGGQFLGVSLRNHIQSHDYQPVFFTNQVDLRRMIMITTPRTIASNCICSTVKWKPEMMMFANAPRPEVRNVVQIAIPQ